MWIKDADFCAGLSYTYRMQSLQWSHVAGGFQGHRTRHSLQSHVVLLNTVCLQITGTQTLSLVSTLSAGGSFTMYSCWLIGPADFLNNTERCELPEEHLERPLSSTGGVRWLSG